MSKSKSSISKAQSYKEIGEFWDTHELTEFWDQTQPVEFEVNIQSEVMYYRLDVALSKKIHLIAEQRGVSPETLLNLWVQEKVQEETT
jgi:CopG antitoxin of type II toxin-antitoxin system